MTTKPQLYVFCRAFVEERIARIQNNIKGIQEALTSETKSSAGDKHETGRAMLQLEREKLGRQLAEAEKMKQTLLKVIVENHFEKTPIAQLLIGKSKHDRVMFNGTEIEIIDIV